MVQARNLAPRLSYAWLVLAGMIFYLAGPAIALEPHSLPASRPWEGSQFVQADGLGNVFFLRPDRLEIYPLSKSGYLGEPVVLQASGTSAGFVREAAMSRAGDRWLLLSGTTVRLFVDGKETIVPPLNWKPWSLTLLRDVPVVAMAPFPMGGRTVDLKRVGTPPWLLRLDSDQWSQTLELKGASVSDLLENGGLNDAIAKNSVVMTGDRNGRLWAARQYAYRVQRFTSSGHLLLEITVDQGEVRKKEQAQGIEIRPHEGAQNPREATQNPRSEKGTSFPFMGERVVYGITEGRDGRIYLLISVASGGAALDRYDPVRNRLDRIPLSVKLKETFTLAAGKDALYLAPWNTDGGRWKISWDELETAPWKIVKGVRVDGFKPEDDAE